LIRRPPRSTRVRSSAASDVYKRQVGQRAPVEIVTGDRDLFQLVDDAAGVRVLYTLRGIGELEVVDQARLAERYGVATGRGYAEMAVLRGDASDGLPGVPGIGEKTAVAPVSYTHLRAHETPE